VFTSQVMQCKCVFQRVRRKKSCRVYKLAYSVLIYSFFFLFLTVEIEVCITKNLEFKVVIR
jgi:hypothetical protein